MMDPTMVLRLPVAEGAKAVTLGLVQTSLAELRPGFEQW